MAYEELYDAAFFEGNLEDSFPVAQYLAPIILEKTGAKRVVDLGCATGHWLKCYRDAGAKIFGVEGSNHAKRSLLVPEKYVHFADLRQRLVMEISQEVDIVFSFEVAEHIDPRGTDNYVSNLTEVFRPKHIIMTAAPPGQGGKGHFNEQPKSYWIDKLGAKGYDFDPQLKDFLTIKIIEGRQWNEAPEHLKAPDKPWAQENAHPTVKGYTGVWIPNWLPDNLMCFKPRLGEETSK